MSSNRRGDVNVLLIIAMWKCRDLSNNQLRGPVPASLNHLRQLLAL